MAAYARRRQIWDPPFGKGQSWLSKGGMSGFLAGGWQVYNGLSLTTGTPGQGRSMGSGSTSRTKN